ncbi:hypothetical protein [Streptomyces sparsogenes]|nr:hypothetical protein [Streptomyces sparsogenes]
MSPDTPSPSPRPPAANQEAAHPSPNTPALDELWRLADQQPHTHTPTHRK